MPRKSRAELEVVTPLRPRPPTPPTISPPAGLSAPAKAIFNEIVGCCDVDHFRRSDVRLLAVYCSAAAMVERCEPHLAGDGDKPPDKEWISAWKEASRTMSNLAMRLRLGPQSRREKALKPKQLDWSTHFRLEREAEQRAVLEQQFAEEGDEEEGEEGNT